MQSAQTNCNRRGWAPHRRGSAHLTQRAPTRQCLTAEADASARGQYDWAQYHANSSQRQERAEWASLVREMTQGVKQRAWEHAPLLDPPPVLADVVLVLVGPKNPANVGTIARSCSAFECLEMHIVESRCIHTARNARSAAKGAAYILYQAQLHDNLRQALEGCHVSVAFTRWVAGQPDAFRDINSLLAHPRVQECLQLQLRPPPPPPLPPPQPEAVALRQADAGAGAVTAAAAALNWEPPAAMPGGRDVDERNSNSSGSGATQEQQRQDDGKPQDEQQQQQQGVPLKMALVFGREELGLSDDELAVCDLTCSIPIGRLQESLSLGHAVTVVLSQLYQARQERLSEVPHQ